MYQVSQYVKVNTNNINTYKYSTEIYMAQIIDSRSSTDQTVKIFDEFYSFNLIINASEYDIVFSYFKSICDTTQIAGNFAVFLFRIAQETQIPVLDLLSYIQGKTKLEVNTVIAYYLNSFKSKTSIYGFGTVPQPNEAVARNIVT